MSNQYIIDVEWENAADGDYPRKRVLINDAEIDEYPKLAVEEFLAQKYGAAVKSYQVVRVLGNDVSRFDYYPPLTESVAIRVEQKDSNLTAVMEIDMDFV